MMNLAIVVAGSAEALLIIARTAWSVDVHLGSAHTAKATVTGPRSVFSKGLPYLRHINTPSPKHSHTCLQCPSGVASAYVTTWDMKRWIAPQGSFVAVADIEVTSTS